MTEPTLGVSPPLDQPYFEGLTEGSSEQGLPWSMGQVVLNGQPYLVDRQSGRYSRRSIQPVTMERAERTGENSSTDNLWRRSFQSYHMGAGQVYVDRDFSNQYRYRDSRGVDPWTEYFLTLLHDVDRVSLLDGLCVVVGAQLAHAHGLLLDWRASLTGPVVTADLPAAAVSVASSGAHLYAALSTGEVVRVAPGSTVVESIATGSYQVVGAVKGRLIGCEANSVYDLTSGTPALIYTHPDEAWVWNSIGDGLVCVYLSGYSGDKSGIYRFALNKDGVQLDPGIQAAQLPDGERCEHVGYYLGYSAIGTSRGVRFGVSDSVGNLTLGRLIETPEPVLCSEGQGNFIWFGWSNVDGEQTGLGRLDPSRFTDPMTPAYATDLMAEGQGAVLSVTTFDGRRVFTVEGLGLFAEAESRLVESGWIDEGYSSWNTPDTKSASYVTLRHGPLFGEIEGQAYVDEAPPRAYGVSSKQGSTSSANFSLEGTLFSAIGLREVLRRDPTDETRGPILTRVELRAVPVSGNSSIFTVPLVVSQDYEYGGRTTWVEAPVEVDRLTRLVDTGAMVVYREGSRAWRVVATAYEWKPEKMTSSGSGWSGLFIIELTEVV